MQRQLIDMQQPTESNCYGPMDGLWRAMLKPVAKPVETVQMDESLATIPSAQIDADKDCPVKSLRDGVKQTQRKRKKKKQPDVESMTNRRRPMQIKINATARLTKQQLKSKLISEIDWGPQLSLDHSKDGKMICEIDWGPDAAPRLACC